MLKTEESAKISTIGKTINLSIKFCPCLTVNKNHCQSFFLSETQVSIQHYESDV